MIEGTRKVESSYGAYEIVFGITGDRFQVQQVITENPKDVDNIPDEEITKSIKETEELLSVWDSNMTEEYKSHLNAKGVELFQ